ncbi:MAG: BCAM0308 family protein [Nitrosomonadales bacterium]|nr:BCAM0308 family protein [Nitrosomonadales bacterium]
MLKPNTVPTGYHQIKSNDVIFKDTQDAYKATKKLPEPTACPQCHAVFRKGRWAWGNYVENAHIEICPACHRANDHFPAGFITLSGDFLAAHKEEISNLIRHVEQRKSEEHPLQRIISSIWESDEKLMVNTTDIHLARGIGEAIQHAYGGELNYLYNPGESLLRVDWKR